MAQVYNWQLGRMMSFPYEERHPRWQFAFVFNINRCIACQTCTMACTSTWTFARGQEAMWWNNVEIKPFGGYPRHWDARLLAMLEEANPGGQVWNLAPREDRQRPYGVFEGKTIFEAAEKRVGPEGPRPCWAICRPTTSGAAPTCRKTAPQDGRTRPERIRLRPRCRYRKGATSALLGGRRWMRTCRWFPLRPTIAPARQGAASPPMRPNSPDEEPCS